MNVGNVLSSCTEPDLDWLYNLAEVSTGCYIREHGELHLNGQYILKLCLYMSDIHTDIFVCKVIRRVFVQLSPLGYRLPRAWVIVSINSSKFCISHFRIVNECFSIGCKCFTVNAMQINEIFVCSIIMWCFMPSFNLAVKPKHIAALTHWGRVTHICKVN